MPSAPLLSSHRSRWGRSLSYSISGTPKPHESEIRSSSIRTTARVPSVEGSAAGTTVPRPCSRTIRGGPSKAQSMRQIRPFSRRCAAVSAPLPTWSSYSTVRSSTIRSVPIGPFGETLT